MNMVFDAPGVYAKGWFAGNKRRDDDTGLEPAQKAIVAACWTLGTVLRDAGVPTRALFCWDGQRKTNKHRKPKPEGYDEGMELFKVWAKEQFPGVPHVQADAEADDLVAASALAAAAEFGQEDVIIVSADKDLQQVASDRVLIYNLGTKEMMTQEDVCRKWDLGRPSHLALRLAVVGDPADAIAGVASMGPKRFTALYEHAKGLGLADAADAIASQLEHGQIAQFESALQVVLLGDAAPAKLGPFSLAESSGELWCHDAWRYVESAMTRSDPNAGITEED